MRRQQLRKCCLHFLAQSPAGGLSTPVASQAPGQKLKHQPPYSSSMRTGALSSQDIIRKAHVSKPQPYQCKPSMLKRLIGMHAPFTQVTRPADTAGGVAVP